MVDSLANAGAAAVGATWVDDHRALVAATGEALGARGPVLVTVDDAHRDPAAPGVVEAWRRAAPEAWFVVSSRQPAPPGSLGAPVGLSRLDPDDAIALLAHRAGVPVDRSDPAVPELVERLDRLPLAVVLAAPRLRVLTPAELVDRLNRRFEVLREGAVSLSAALGSAWDALGTGARLGLARLAAVEADLPLTLAEAILGPSGLDLLQELVDGGWLATRAREGGSWAVLPENQRAWVRAEGDPNARAEGARATATWFVAEGAPRARSRTDRRTAENAAWLRQHASALVATVDALAVGFPTPEAQATETPSVLVRTTLVAVDAIGGPIHLLERVANVGLALPGQPPSARAPMMVALAGAAGRSGGPALQLSRRAAEEADRSGDPVIRAFAWSELARTTALVGDIDEAGALADEAIRIAGDADPEHQALALLARFLARGRRLGDPT